LIDNLIIFVIILIMNFLSSILPYFQIIISILLITAILLQQRGAGLSEAFGGSGGGFHTKRGLEKILFIATIVLSFIFILSNLLGFLL